MTPNLKTQIEREQRRIAKGKRPKRENYVFRILSGALIQVTKTAESAVGHVYQFADNGRLLNAAAIDAMRQADLLEPVEAGLFDDEPQSLRWRL